MSRSNRANRADRPYLSFLFDMSTVYDPYMSYLSDLSYQSYQSSWSNLSDLSNQPNQSYLSFQWYLSYRSDLTDRTNLSYRLDLSDLLNLSNLSNYEHYKQKHTTYMTAFDKYGFKKSLDSTKVKIIGSSDSLTVYRAALPYSIEHAVYAVKHARLYLAKKIYTRHWTLVLKYDLLLAALFYFIPFISIRHMFGLLASCLLGSILIAFKLPKEISNEIGKNISNGVYLLLPMLSCLILHWALLRKKVKT